MTEKQDPLWADKIAQSCVFCGRLALYFDGNMVGDTMQDGWEAPLKYWSNPYNHAMSSRSATLNMVAEFLLEHGYQVLKWSAASVSVMRVGIGPYPSPEDSALSYLRVCSLDDIAENVKDAPLVSYLVVINESQIDCWNSVLPLALSNKVAVVLTKSVDVARTVEQIGNYLIGLQELCSSLALAVSSSSLCQALVNIAEDYFGCYMHITDASHMLIAYAHHVKPLDEISRSLIRDKFLRKEILEREGIGSINKNMSCEGVKIFRLYCVSDGSRKNDGGNHRRH